MVRRRGSCRRQGRRRDGGSVVDLRRTAKKAEEGGVWWALLTLLAFFMRWRGRAMAPGDQAEEVNLHVSIEIDRVHIIFKLEVLTNRIQLKI